MRVLMRQLLRVDQDSIPLICFRVRVHSDLEPASLALVLVVIVSDFACTHSLLNLEDYIHDKAAESSTPAVFELDDMLSILAFLNA